MLKTLWAVVLLALLLVVLLVLWTVLLNWYIENLGLGITFLCFIIFWGIAHLWDYLFRHLVKFVRS